MAGVSCDLLANYRVYRALNIQQASPGMIFLHVTKLDSVDRFLALEFLGQSCTSFDFLAADSTRGGILVAWNQDLVHAEAPNKKALSLSLKLTSGMQSMTVGEPKWPTA
jgi:hypothetical protein